MSWTTTEEKTVFEAHHFENNLKFPPYEIDKDGYFKTLKNYPSFFAECENNQVPMHGDCLLRLFTHTGKFRCMIGDFVMEAEPITDYITKDGHEIKLFEGLPTKLCAAPILETDDHETIVYAMYEQYGANKSNELINYRYPNNPNHSVRVRDKNGKSFVIDNMDYKGTHLNTLTVVT